IAVTFVQVSPYVGRLGGVSLDDTWFMPFSPQSCISFLVPFATVKDIAWYDTDISMNNAYVGLVMLIFFMLTLFSKRKLILNVFIVFGLVSLLASFGQATPVRAFLYHVFPLLDMFRHSSFFSYFAVITIIPAAATGLGNYLANPPLYKKKLCWITLATGLVVIGLLISAIAGIQPEASFFLKPADDFAAWLQEPGRQEHIIIHALIQLIMLTVFIVFALKRSEGSFKALALIIAIEMLISVQLNTYYTVVSAGVNPLELKHNLDQRARGFPVPQAGVPVGVNTEMNAAYSVIWLNTNIFNKTVSFEGYNSFRLKGYESLADSFPSLAAAICRNELLYLSDKIEPFDKNKLGIADSLKTVLFTGEPDIPGKHRNLKLSPGDSVRITGFRPGYVQAEINCSDSLAVTFLQEWYPGWKVKVDGVGQPAFVTNKMAISTIVPSGRHIIEYSYFNRPVFIAFIFSYLTVLVIISLLLFFQVRSRNKTFRISIIILLWVTVCSLSFYRFGYTSYEAQKLAQYRETAKTIVKSGVSSVVCNVDDREMMRNALTEAGYQGKSYFNNLTYAGGLSGLIESLDSTRDQKVAKVDLFAANPDEAEAAFRINWPVLIESYSYKAGSLSIYTTGNGLPGFTEINDFETVAGRWIGDAASIDSLHFFKGKFSNRVDSKFAGSHAFKWKPAAEFNHRSFELFIKAKLSGDYSGASLIIQQRRNKLIIRSFSVNLGTYRIASQDWVNVAKYGLFPEGAVEGDEISVFFWGNGKSTFFVDNFLVDVRFVE
ncbi:MAG: YfhO family protein, partial [Lentimicrobium sp.]|nr:YfhO family protein [Lentimicrobium sp.]